QFERMVDEFEIKKKASKKKSVKIDISDMDTVIKNVEKLSKEVILELSKISDRIELAETELDKNKAVIEIAKNLIPFGFSFEDLDEERPYFTIIVGRLETKRIPRFKWNLDAVTDSNYILKDSESEGNYSFVAIGFLERYQEEINRLLVAYGFEKFSIPERVSGSPEIVVQKSKNKIEKLEARIKELHEEADKLIEQYGAEILAYNEQLFLEENYLKIKNKIRLAKKNTTVWGWISKKSIKKIENIVQNFSKNSASVEFSEPVFEESEYPTKTSFPRVIKIFDNLVSAYGVPGYNEFNPAILLTFFYPIIFGIMFADVGHGLLFTLLGVYGLTLQKKRLDSGSFGDELKGYFKNGAMLIILSGVASMIFGVIFGSYFGITHENAGYIPNPLWFGPESHSPPAYNPQTSGVILMLELSLLLGMIHMTVGYVFRFIKHVKEKHLLEAILVDLMLAVFHWGLFILVFTFGTNFMTWFQWDNGGYFDMAIISVNGNSFNFFYIRHALLFFIVAFALPAIVMTGYLFTHGLDGVAELIELLLSTLSNTVSYARIFAMNAVHGALSQVFLLTTFTGEGLGVVNYIGAAIGALVIVALEGLFSFIQTLRLQWVEFFAKMGYQGTGTKFQAMAYERKYSIPA
ncbi:MAG: hypothetical protein EU548_01905, partial [Promethearchaeota archaeon]